MGMNDTNPTGSASLQPWKQREPQAVLTWGNIPADLIVELITVASRVGAYIAFGANQDSTALLLYIRNGRINERVAIESVKESRDAIKWVLENYLKPV